MKKLGVLLYGFAVLGLGFYGLSNHSYYVQVLINLGRPYMVVRTALVIILVFYAFIPWLRTYVAKTLLGIGGMTLLFMGLLSVGSPSLLGHLHIWMRPGDNLMLIEGGILAVVLSAELSARRTRFMARSYAHVQLLFVTQPRKLVYSVVSKRVEAINIFEQVLNMDRVIPAAEPQMRMYTMPNKGVP